MYVTDEEVRKRVIRHSYEALEKLKEKGLEVGVDYFVEATTLQGSQNYGTHHSGSDVDTKLVVTPSYRSLLKGVRFNETLILDNGEHCDVRTGQDMIANICKGNINWIEGLYTKFSANFREGSWWADMCNLRDEIVGAHRTQIMSAVYGMSQQKQASLFKPTATTKPYFDEHGFDNKNFIHVLRLSDFAKTFYTTQDFAKSLDYSDRGRVTMHLIRSGGITADHAERIVAESVQMLGEIYQQTKCEWEKPQVDFKKRLEERYVEWVA